jgi:hypothetical protein
MYEIMKFGSSILITNFVYNTEILTLSIIIKCEMVMVMLSVVYAEVGLLNI